MKKSEHPVRDLIKRAEAVMHQVTVKSEESYIDQDCGGSVSEYCKQFKSKKTKKQKDYNNHYKQVPAERLVIEGLNGRTIIVEVKYEKVK